MPCPHFEVSLVKRSAKKSAVTGAAYKSRSDIYSDYEQKWKKYKTKPGVIHTEILLPKNAPEVYRDRGTLWNAAEKAETQWNAQLARRIIIALPVEVPADQYPEMVRAYCQKYFVDEGMSYKLKKRLLNAPENILEIPNTQEAIIPLAQWERVQELLDEKRRPTKEPNRQGLFSGLLFCADCGTRLYYWADPRGKTNRDSYYCGKYALGRGDCSAHYIRETVLKTIILDQIKYMTSYVAAEAVDFAGEWMQSQRKRQEKELQQAQKRMEQAKKRSDEIDDLLTHTYEDYAKGILTLERYQKMPAKYEQEQKELTEEISTLDKIVRRQEETSDQFAQFMNLLRKYVGEDIAELTPTIVNEFVKRIIVHEADKSSGKRVQQIEIIFNFIGELDFPVINQPITLVKGLNEKTA